MYRFCLQCFDAYAFQSPIKATYNLFVTISCDKFDIAPPIFEILHYDASQLTFTIYGLSQLHLSYVLSLVVVIFWIGCHVILFCCSHNLSQVTTCESELLSLNACYIVLFKHVNKCSCIAPICILVVLC